MWLVVRHVLSYSENVAKISNIAARIGQIFRPKNRSPGEWQLVLHRFFFFLWTRENSRNILSWDFLIHSDESQIMTLKLSNAELHALIFAFSVEKHFFAFVLLRFL